MYLTAPIVVRNTQHQIYRISTQPAPIVVRNTQHQIYRISTQLVGEKSFERKDRVV